MKILLSVFICFSPLMADEVNLKEIIKTLENSDAKDLSKLANTIKSLTLPEQNPYLEIFFKLALAKTSPNELQSKTDLKIITKRASKLLEVIVNNKISKKLYYRIMQYYSIKLKGLKLNKKELLLICKSSFAPYKFLKKNAFSKDKEVRIVVANSFNCPTSSIQHLLKDIEPEVRMAAKKYALHAKPTVFDIPPILFYSN